MRFTGRRLFASIVGCGLVSVTAPCLFAKQPPAPPRQASGQNQAQGDQGQDQEQDPLKRQRSPQETYKARKELRQELKGTYKTWLNDEVPYIISDEERK